MTVGELVHQHLWLALVTGSLVEGETTAILAGFAARRAEVAYPAVVAVAALVNFVLDTALFAVAYRAGPRLLGRWPSLAARVAVLTPRLAEHRRLAVFFTRFAYGLRTVGPLALGLVRIPPREYLTLNAAAALIWALAFTGLGYLFGERVAGWLHALGHHHLLLASVAVGAGLIVLLHRTWWGRTGYTTTNRPDPR